MITLFQKFPFTSLKAFNSWYADLPICDSADVTATWLGMSKDLWVRGLSLES